MKDRWQNLKNKSSKAVTLKLDEMSDYLDRHAHSSKGVEIKKLDSSNDNQVKKFFKLLNEKNQSNDDDDELRELLDECEDEGTIFICLRNKETDTFVGYIALELQKNGDANILYIAQLYVSPAQRGKGLAKMLVDIPKELAATFKCGIDLHDTHNTKMPFTKENKFENLEKLQEKVGIDFYEKQGFERIKERGVTHQMKQETAESKEVKDNITTNLTRRNTM